MNAAIGEGAKAETTLLLVDQRQSPYSHMAIAAPVLASVAFVLELTITPAIIPAIQNQFGAELPILSLYLNVYSLAVAAGVLMSCGLGDRLPKASVFLVGSALFTIGSFALVFSQLPSSLLLSRVTQGVGAGLFLPLISILIAQATPDKPGQSLISWGSVSGFVAALAPAAHGYFLSENNWTATYALLGVFGFLSAVFSTLSRSTAEGSPGENKRTSRRLLLSDAGLIAIFLYIFCTYGAVTYFFFKVPFILIDGGFAPSEVGGALTMAWLSFSVVSFGIRNFVDRDWLCKILLAAPMFIAGGLLLLVLPLSAYSIVAASSFVGTGLACSNSPSTQVVLRFAPTDMQAFVSGIDITVARLGGILTTSLAAFLLPEIQMTVLLGLLLGSMVSMHWVVKRLRMLGGAAVPGATGMPRLIWSTVMFKRRGTENGEQATQARGNSSEVTAG